MAELNWAYAVLREPGLRASFDNARVPIPVATPSPTAGTLSERVAEVTEAAIGRDSDNPANTTLDFGRFAGMTLRQIARVDPGYLEWLRRHSSGLRYRHQIDTVLGSMAGARPSSAE
jgi:hypothetical protein